MANNDEEVIPGVRVTTRSSDPGVLVREITFGTGAVGAEQRQIQVIDPSPPTLEIGDQIFRARMACGVEANPFDVGLLNSIPGSGLSYINNNHHSDHDNHLKPLADAVRRAVTKDNA